MEYKITGQLQGKQKTAIIDASDDMEAINNITAKFPGFEVSSVHATENRPRMNPKKSSRKSASPKNTSDSPESFATACQMFITLIRVLGWVAAIITMLS